ncbi:MAG: MBL fold metallo-hydrolase [Clostridia bacterium]|nr:MBL fold metallo-hydrolase [Clostridia bacterium]
MEITFLGTGSAEMYPSLFCDCPNCLAARTAGGKNIRGNSSVMIDGDLLIDLNPAAFLRANLLGISLTGLRLLLVTHTHPDHFIPSLLKWRRVPAGQLPPFDPEITSWSARYTPVRQLTVIGTAEAEEILRQQFPEQTAEDHAMTFRSLLPGESAAEGPYRVTAVRANHGKRENFANCYIIEKDGRRLLYALDTGGFQPDMLRLIGAYRYDCVIADGTFGKKRLKTDDDDGLNGTGHMGLRADIRLRSLLLDQGCIGADTPFVLSHLCPHFAPPHDAYADEVKALGMLLAWDGMRMTV